MTLEAALETVLRRYKLPEYYPIDADLENLAEDLANTARRYLAQEMANLTLERLGP